jgi:hypothetical protein
MEDGVLCYYHDVIALISILLARIPFAAFFLPTHTSLALGTPFPAGVL